MRIGILTLPLHTNYGGILQAYALQTVLERMGHETYVLDKPFKLQHLPFWRRLFFYTKQIIKKYILGKPVGVIGERKRFERDKVERKYTQPFIDKNVKRFLINNLCDIQQNDFDAFVVGSDQIWRMLYFKLFWSTRNSADAFLEFTDGWNVRRISFAASFGIDVPDILPKELKSCQIAIGKFNAVSVREESGVTACRKYLNREAKWVIDPTMLLTSSDYSKLIPGEINHKPILMSYVLDESPKIAALRELIAKSKHLTVKLTNLPDTGTEERGLCSQPPVEDWLRAFAESDYVINDSFHACVFSILFHKQFTVIGNKKRGLARFQSLLKLFDLQDRLITDPSDYKDLPPIDYDKVDAILNTKRQEAFEFLRRALSY